MKEGSKMKASLFQIFKRNLMVRGLALVFFVGLMVTGCMVGPKYARPEVSQTESFVNKNKFVNDQDSVLNLKWFELFGDEVLIAVIDSALNNNLDLKIAMARIEESRALYGFSKADLFPQFGYGISAGSNNISEQVTDQIGLQGSTITNYQALGNVSWEIDIWGKIRHSKRAALNELLASMEARKAIQSTLISDVAALYFQLRDFDNRLVIARSTVASRQKYYDKMEARFNGGDISELDLLQSEQQLRDAQAAVPNFERQVAFTTHALNVLLGQSTQPVLRGLENVDQPAAPIIPSGIPSTLLEQRPDVKGAEFVYMASVERIGVAQAARFPSLSLTGNLGVASGDLSSLLTGSAATSAIAGNLVGPIFQFGKNKRRVEAQQYVAEAAMHNYVNTYLIALADVENSLVAVETFKTEYDARILQLTAAARNLELSRARYDNGFTSYLEVLIAESNLFSASLAASSVRAQQLNSSVTLYRALGGGWQ